MCERAARRGRGRTSVVTMRCWRSDSSVMEFLRKDRCWPAEPERTSTLKKRPAPEPSIEVRHLLKLSMGGMRESRTGSLIFVTVNRDKPFTKWKDAPCYVMRNISGGLYAGASAEDRKRR